MKKRNTKNYIKPKRQKDRGKTQYIQKILIRQEIEKTETNKTSKRPKNRKNQKQKQREKKL